jgi:hypothetical protein
MPGLQKVEEALDGQRKAPASDCSAAATAAETKSCCLAASVTYEQRSDSAGTPITSGAQAQTLKAAGAHEQSLLLRCGSSLSGLRAWQVMHRHELCSSPTGWRRLLLDTGTALGMCARAEKACECACQADSCTNMCLGPSSAFAQRQDVCWATLRMPCCHAPGWCAVAQGASRNCICTGSARKLLARPLSHC